MRKKKNSAYPVGSNLLDEVWSLGLTIYLFAILLIFPVYIHDKYWDMALNKWKIYYHATTRFAIFVGIMLVIWGGYKIYRRKRYGEKPAIDRLSLPDRAMVFYSALVLLSFGLCNNRQAAWQGIDGWYMGVLAQLMFIGSYFVFSRRVFSTGLLLGFHGGAALFAGFYAICQRVDFDWMYLYWDMPAEVLRDYISTIGNRTWFSGYLCTAFPIGIYFYWYLQGKMKRIASTIVLLLMFMCMVSVGSDSIFVALAAVFYILFLFSVGDWERSKRLLEIVGIWFLAGTLMQVLRATIAVEPPDIRGISGIFLSGSLSVIGFLIVAVLWVGISLLDGTIPSEWKRQQVYWDSNKKKRVQRIILISTGILLWGILVLIALNTSGVLQQLFGVSIQNKYLLFDDNWGDYRGHTWKLTMKMLWEMPPGQKLLGVGADCYAYYAYSNTEYAEALQYFWGNSVMANAHNEWLNSLVCYGILGGLAYIGCFVTVAYNCLKGTGKDNVNPLAPAVGLCVVAYMAHNFFCYQQICATPIMFILMGAAMNVLKKKD